MKDFKQMLNVVEEHGKECECCIYNDGCNKEVSGSPNGPIYPPCCDADTCFDEELVKEVYKNIKSEEK